MTATEAKAKLLAILDDVAAGQEIYSTATENGWRLVTKDTRLRGYRHTQPLTLWRPPSLRAIATTSLPCRSTTYPVPRRSTRLRSCAKPRDACVALIRFMVGTISENLTTGATIHIQRDHPEREMTRDEVTEALSDPHRPEAIATRSGVEYHEVLGLTHAGRPRLATQRGRLSAASLVSSDSVAASRPPL